MNDFNEDCTLAAKSTKTLQAHFLKLPFVKDIVELQAVKHYQQQGVDWHLKCKSGDFYVELKADRHQARNFVFETQSNTTTGSIGCFLYSKADFWVYHFVNERVFYIFDHRKALSLFNRKYINLKSRFATTFVGNNYYKTKFTLVKIKEFEQDMQQENALFQKVQI